MANNFGSLSARRAWIEIYNQRIHQKKKKVALRKESVDRNSKNPMISIDDIPVALRKESVDRNSKRLGNALEHLRSLSARRAWIEIRCSCCSVQVLASLSARRAWIEI